MRNIRITRRYAKAITELSIKKNSLESCYQDMLCIKKSCDNSRELRAFIKSPIIKTDKKQNILREIFLSKISKLSMEFINIITSKKRETMLLEIAEEAMGLYKKHNKIETVKVTTAEPIDEYLKKEITDFIQTKTNKKVELEEQTNKRIIGGAIIRMEDKQLDISISKAINTLKQKFSKNLYIKDF